jgi:hypothetical protein
VSSDCTVKDDNFTKSLQAATVGRAKPREHEWVEFLFQKLWQELRAINLWNKNYEAGESHDFIERASCAARRRRMREIVLELSPLIREVSRRSLFL